ncbi:metallophosphoesterase family protein [Aestuariicoccus sp. MJ-SS9]|uniref:metallophosphoesterase family protein n=1 Tax=Aestuariicoccus sp. MJ-SS9 TaxID=3079855 RepID=UPI00290BAC5F|nr:metallophosphoesterase family protein [Aestuariicoccus sp. MJ-SS9]MDU8913018.1 metallophosphoesterase family protein [Aestuariicoccus sp. MJ-SS9]
MKLHDLGRLEGPVLAFGGPYSNLQALEALIARAEALGIGADRMICTGDVVAYCGDPKATVDLMRARGIVTIAGNVERQLGAGALDCGCGFETGSACDLLSAGWYAHVNAATGAETRRWMADLPDVATFTQAGRRFAVIHGGVTDISRFLWPVSPEAEFTPELAVLTDLTGPIDAVISGHCGVAFMREVQGVHWINAGVIGMPPNDGTARTEFAVLSDGRAELLRLTYDAAAARTRMIDAGLTQGYHEALITGFWPSEDVLPASMRRQSRAIG